MSYIFMNNNKYDNTDINKYSTLLTFNVKDRRLKTLDCILSDLFVFCNTKMTWLMATNLLLINILCRTEINKKKVTWNNDQNSFLTLWHSASYSINVCTHSFIGSLLRSSILNLGSPEEESPYFRQRIITVHRLILIWNSVEEHN